MYFKSLCITFGLLMFMACGGGGGGGGSSSKSTPNIALSEKSYDFSGIVVNNTADHRFEIRNTGKANLTIGQIKGLTPPYSIYDGCSNETLRASGSCTVRARFAPKDQGVFADQILIPSNDPDEKTAKINLLGTGYDLNVWFKQASAAVAGCLATVGVTVTDSAGIFLDDSDLDTVNDFYFEVNGNAVDPADVTFVDYEEPSPISLVLAIDWSVSEKAVIGDIKTAAKTFINSLNKTPGNSDEAVICKFNNVIEFDRDTPDPFYSLDSAADVDDMEDYIDGNFDYGTGTYLYDAVYKSIDRAFDEGNEMPVVVVLSDGVDSGSPNHTLNQVITHATDKEVPVFTIYYRDPNFRTGYGDPNTLETLADDTGGQHFDGMTSDLDTVYSKIVNIIQNMFIYELTLPAGCSVGDTASLKVEVGGPHPAPYGEDSTSVTFELHP